LNIYAALKRLRPSTSIGLDYIPASVINGCSEIFMPVHRFIFDPSLSQKNVHILCKPEVLFVMMMMMMTMMFFWVLTRC
jgi:hypothetical protein